MIDTLKNKLELLVSLLETQKTKIDNMKDSVKLSTGAHVASTEIVKSFDEYVSKRQQEWTEAVKGGTLNLDVANYALSSLNQVKIFLRENVLSYDRINHARQGELIAHNQQFNELMVLSKETQKQLEEASNYVTQPQAISAQQVVESPTVSQVETKDESSSQPSLIRPDQRETRIGKAARDIINRRKAAQTNSDESTTVQKAKGRPKK